MTINDIKFYRWSRAAIQLPVLFVLALMAATALSEPVFKYFPRHRLNMDFVPLFLDLTGDGKNEIIYLSRTNAQTSESSVVQVLKENNGVMEPWAMVPFPSEFVGELVPVTHEDGLSTLLASVSIGTHHEIWELGGSPFRVLRKIETPIRVVLQQVADLTGEGRLEILGAGLLSGWIVAIDYVTGEGLRPIVEANAAKAMQLDDDAALEVVASTWPGWVVDGRDGHVEWEHVDGFIGPVLAGRFDIDPSRSTFVVQESNWIRVFSGHPYSLLNSFYVHGLPGGGSNGPGSIYSVVESGRDQYIFPSNAGGIIYAVDPLSGEVVWTTTSPWRNSSPPAFGKIDSEGPIIMIHGAGGSLVSNAANGMQVRDLSSGALLFETEYEIGRYQRSAFIDRIHTEDGSEYVTLYSTPIGVSWTASIKVIDSTGSVSHRRTGLSELNRNWHRPVLHVEDLDGEPGDEIIVADLGWIANLDGVTLADRWRVQMVPGVLNFDTKPLAIATVDFNGDGIKDIALLVEDNLSNRKVIVFSGVDGEALWQSVSASSFPSFSSLESRPLLSIIPGNDDKAPLIVFSVGLTILAFDIDTRLLAWQIGPLQAQFGGFITWGHRESCGIGAIFQQNRMVVHDCQGRSVGAEIPLPTGTDLIAALDEEGTRFVATAAGHIHLLGRGGLIRSSVEHFGNSLSGSPTNAVKREGVGAIDVDVLVGSTATMVRYRIDVDSLFTGDFENPLIDHLD